jgi:hypothetical protein
MLRNQKTLLVSVALVLTVICITGCRCSPPGPMNQQQSSAVVHDPFPQNDIAPYEAASRPPSYQQPLPLPVRNRLVPDAMPWLGR